MTESKEHTEYTNQIASHIKSKLSSGYIPAYGVVDDPPPRVLTITRPRRPPLTPLGRGR